KTITVDRYTLPKFKIEIELSGDEAKKQSSYYAPGETVSGKVAAHYLFGKPLANASVTLTLTTFDVQSVELARLTGKTDAEGRFSFSSRLPDFFAGRSTQQGSAPVAIGVEVKDTADHTETKSRNILVSKTPILIMAVPESGQLLPKLENRVYILTSYPDGSPAKTVVTGNVTPERVETDASGVAIISIRAESKPVVLNLKATDTRGRTAQADVKLESATQSQSLMLRTNKSVFKVGERLRLETISTKQRGAVYIDVVKNGQTLVTRAIDTNGGRGELSLDLTQGMFGTIEVRAYQITSDADPILDRRLIYVDPADDLKVEVSAERESYKPGEDASINFRVTDQAGRPVSAALGIEIVDEAVFALSDKHPGFEKVFMYLEKELLTPRYEVHQFSFDDVLFDVPEDEKPQAANRERAAQVLLAAAGTVRDKDVRAEFGREAIEAKRDEYIGRYMSRINEKAQSLAKALTSYYERRAASSEGFNRDLLLFAAENSAQSKMLEDPWGNRLVGEGKFTNEQYSYLTLRSPGPDGRDKTADDLAMQVYAQSVKTVRPAPFKGNVSVRADSVAGNRAVIEGVVKDDRGRSIAGVPVAAQRISNGRKTYGYTDMQGRFTIANLAPGSYQVIFESTTYRPTTYKSLALDRGSRAVIEATLEQRGPTPISLTVYPNYANQVFALRDGVGRRAGAGGGGGFARRKAEALPVMEMA
ncbi:MAG TPA: carboxypeptidase regulatory-like domain-containing protein, partial [Blastocatellia bacterium]|nr:carboxypeptidase regulatory-like domain-containing protein [Blastocatellia bacterium]